MDDSKEYAIATRASETDGQYNPYMRPTLVVRCRRGRTDVYVGDVTGPRTGSTLDDMNAVSVRLRFENEPPLRRRWNSGMGSDAIFASEGVRFARQMAGHRLLKIEYATVFGRSSVLTFAIDGIDDHLPKIARTCGWKT